MLKVLTALRSLSAEQEVRVKVTGTCMRPLLEPGDQVLVKAQRVYLPGDCLVFIGPGNQLLAHRLIGYYFKQRRWRYLTQADQALAPDRYLFREDIVGRIQGGDCTPRLHKIPITHRIRALQKFWAFVNLRIAQKTGRH